LTKKNATEKKNGVFACTFPSPPPPPPRLPYFSRTRLDPKADAQARKWLHAVAVEPVAFMTPDALNDAPPGTTPSPFELHASSDGTSVAAKGERRARYVVCSFSCLSAFTNQWAIF
jgi:hypothetical protein